METYYLTSKCCLKHLETPCVYDVVKDELYEVDDAAFEFLKACSTGNGATGGDSGFISYCVEEGILTSTPVSIARPPVNPAPQPSLRYLELQLTAMCNLQCRHCYIGAPEQVSLPLDAVTGILTEFESMQGLRLLLTGGEPLMYPDFAELNRRLPMFAMRKVLLTNGILLNDGLLQGLNVDEIQISIDGLEPGHDAIRGPGTYKKAVMALERARHIGFDVSVATTIHSKNIGEFAAMEKMFINMDIKDWTVDVPVTMGNLLRNESLVVPPDIAGKLLSYGFGGGLHGDSSDGAWACGLHLMSVGADGGISKCLYYAGEPVGSIKDGLQTCWSRIEPLPIGRLKCDCSMRETCRGGCRYRAAALGDPLGKDLFKCHSLLY